MKNQTLPATPQKGGVPPLNRWGNQASFKKTWTKIRQSKNKSLPLPQEKPATGYKRPRLLLICYPLFNKGGLSFYISTNYGFYDKFRPKPLRVHLTWLNKLNLLTIGINVVTYIYCYCTHLFHFLPEAVHIVLSMALQYHGEL